MLMACGDFNAMNPAYGYNKYTTKPRDLCQDVTGLDFSLIKDLMHPTGIGNSVARDTAEDLTFIKKDVRRAMTSRNGGGRSRQRQHNRGNRHTGTQLHLHQNTQMDRLECLPRRQKRDDRWR